MTDAPPSAFGSMMASGAPARPRRDRRRSGRCERVDAHEQARALRGVARVACRNAARAARASRLALGRDGILEIDDERVGAARQALVELLGGCRRERTGGSACGPSCVTARPHPHEGLAAAFGDQLAVLLVGAVVELDDAGVRAATSIRACRGPRWCNARCRPRTAGAGNFTSVMPRLAMVVPTVMSLTEMPIIRPSVNSEFISGWPHSVSGLAEMPVDVQRLRIERHVGEQHVVHLRHGAGAAGAR